MNLKAFQNPFRPGAGHKPPYLAGRKNEESEFRRLLKQSPITENLILTGLRGVGKTVLLESFKPIALSEGWLWVGTDLSESASITEANLATRLLTDLAVVTSSLPIGKVQHRAFGFVREDIETEATLDYRTLASIYEMTPGLVSDKLKAIFRIVSQLLKSSGKYGIIFAYDEAQNLADHAEKDEFPLSLLLEIFQAVQREDAPFILLLVGLPTLFPKLVEARTYAERMFRVMFLKKLKEQESRDAIKKPIEDEDYPVKVDDKSVETIIRLSGGYPYFIQFICREVFDVWLQKISTGRLPSVPTREIVRKLDTDFFAGRWAKATDRQRELLFLIATLETGEEEFTVQEIVEASKKKLEKPFSSSHVNQMLSTLSDAGLVYKNRYGKYMFAVPLMADFLKRIMRE